ncbi:N-acyl homoserine lactonase family protein [Haloplanus pelagicus]|jgi:glyoxylase-like metal-dependent hydrolase (beta-lactamase superfamily II)|uniref:N-acyl homoserine lactonase family protein n=1 Tax=Haloplanus pelagicus TaxID=2949995 RepID=UPI0020413865|nr:N-acyl homoserine lactonase family protein [Haloplanus sp. HW8-1]
MTPTVTPRCCGSFETAASVLVEGAEGVVRAPSIVYLIEAEETILVDTGFGPVDLMAERHPSFDCRRDPGQSLEAILDDEGYAPADLDGVVLSHLDWDHCYNLDRFDGVTDVYVQRRELEYAIAPYPMHADRYDAKSLGREPPWLTVDVTPLDGETELCPGVTAFPTPGHTVGHQSVSVETAAGTTVVAVDAVPTFENAPDDGPPVRGLSMDEFDWWESAIEVLDRADELLPGHEWEVLDAEPP